MSRMLVWFWLSCKRYGRKPSFLALLLLLPLGAYMLSLVGGEDSMAVRIALYAEDGADSLGARLVQDLAEPGPGGEPGEPGDGGMFSFYICGSGQQVEEEVASRRAECGYVVYAGLKEKLDRGQYKRCIGVYSSPSTVVAALSTETVFAAMAGLYDKELLMDYVARDEIFEPLGELGSARRRELSVKAGELYEKWRAGGGTFRFAFYQAEGGTEKEWAAGSFPGGEDVFPVRGIVAVYLFLVSLYSAVCVGMDEEQGLFLPLPYSQRLSCRLACLAAPVMMAAASGLAALACGGAARDILGEAATLAVYGLSLVLVSYVFKVITRRHQALCCLIPFFLIGSLLFCPVFVDIGHFIPAFRHVGRLFPPYYYLRGI